MSKGKVLKIIAGVMLSVTVSLTLGTLAHAAERVAVIIGNRDYKAPVPDVVYAANDAAAFSYYAVNVLGVDPANVIDLRDATLAELTAVFGAHDAGRGRISDLVKEGQTEVTVFYSGHGVPGLKDKRGYLLPVDGDPGRAELTGYSLDLMVKNLARLPAKSIQVFIDACFSGTSSGGQLVTGVSGLTIEPELPASGMRVHMLTAARADEVASWDKNAGHGLFTEYLMRGLHGEAAKGKYGSGTGRITMAGLKGYLDDQMTFAARRDYGRDQHPVLDGDGGLQVADINLKAPPPRPKIVAGNAIQPDAPVTAQAATVPDDIEMRNGDKFKGKVLVESVTILTPFGKVTVPRSAIAELHLTGDNMNVETILTVYGGRFSGQFLDNQLEVEMGGNTLAMRKEKVAAIRFAPAGTPAKPNTTAQVSMRNSDIFTVDVVTTDLKVRTSYGELSFKKEDIKEIAFEGDQRVIGKVTLKEDKGVFQGDLLNEEIELRTAFGASLLVYKDKLAKVDFAPEQLHPTSGQVAEVVVPSGGDQNPGRVFRDCDDCPEMVVVPAGSFVMGDWTGDGEGDDDEYPFHEVTIPKAFAVGKYEVTQAEWRSVMHNKRKSRTPIVEISWDEVKDFVDKLSARTGKQYRLLSEAEWEYAARAGTTTKWHCGNNRSCLKSVAVFGEKKAQPVGSKGANAFGLHDMHGNAWEWVEDCWNNDYVGAPTDGSANTSGECSRRVVRGGAWDRPPKILRSASRSWNGITATYRDSRVGFRVARDL